MENSNGKSLLITALQYAGVLAVVMAVLTLVSYLTGLSYFWGGAIANVLKGVVFLIGFILVLVNWRKKSVEITYKNAFMFGSLIVIGYVLMITIFDYIFYAFIAPDFYNELRTHTLQMMIEYNLPEAQIDETDAQFEKGMAGATPIKMSLNTGIARLVADLILLSIVAIFLRKKLPVVHDSLPSNSPQ